MSTALREARKAIDFGTRTEIQEASLMLEASLNQVKYDIAKLTDHNLSGRLIDVYLDEAKYNVESAIRARKEMKKSYKKLSEAEE